VVVIDRVRPYTLLVLAGVRDVLEATGTPLLVHVNDYFTNGLPGSLANRIRAGAFRGVISLALSSTRAHDEMHDLLSAHPDLPVVTIGGGPRGGPGSRAEVATDNAAGMRAVMRHLLDEQGVRRVALVRGVPHHRDSAERERVVREELAARGIGLPDDLVLDGDFDSATTYHGVLGLLRTGSVPEAVVALNDQSAVGAIDAVGDHGLRVPEDVAVTGFDDDSGWRSRCPLTTADQQLRSQGATAALLLLTRMHGGTTAERVTMPSRLVVRESSLRRPDALPGALPGAPEAGPVPIVMPLPHLRELDTMDAVLAMNRSFMLCTTEQEVMDALAATLPRLDITHCYVVLHDAVRPEATPIGRLALVHPAPDPSSDVAAAVSRPFPITSVLPDALREEISSGTLLMQSLSLAGHELGYVLYRQPGLRDVTAEVLRMDLTRALDGVARHRHLERLVRERTRTLHAEIAVRRRAETALSSANAELSALNVELRRNADLDGLTGVANRRAFDAYLERVWHDRRSAGQPLSLIFVDVDHFKAFNDNYGHLAGDDALRVVATALVRAARGDTDLVARYGGEEFVLVLPSTAPDDAHAVARRVRRLVRRDRIPHVGSPVCRWLTVSQSVATVVPARRTDPRALIAAADLGLYRAKAAGRDRIVVVDAPRPSAVRDDPVRDTPALGIPARPRHRPPDTPTALATVRLV
jgi:diguanylate cyclase (GGDEF)-like protein